MRAIATLADIDALHRAFGDDRARYRFLERLRWPHGFVCGRCGVSRTPERPTLGICVCGQCGHFRRVVADSVMSDGRVSLARWFGLFWMLASGGLPLDMHHLAELLEAGGARAKLVLRELAAVLAFAEAEPLSGVVELDAGVLDAADPHAIVLVAVERPDDGFGRLRMRHVPAMAPDRVRNFVEETIVVGSTLRTDCWSADWALGELPYQHEPEVVPPPDAGGLEGPAVALRLLRQYSKARPPKGDLTLHLDAFALRFNRSTRFTVGEVFCHLVQSALQLAETRTNKQRRVSGVQRIAGLARAPHRGERQTG